MAPRAFAPFVLLLFLAWPLAGLVAVRARRSSRHRLRFLGAGIGLVGLGLVVGLILPHHVRETAGSPASLIVVILLWLCGAGLGYLGSVLLAGVLLAARKKRPDSGLGIHT